MVSVISTIGVGGRSGPAGGHSARISYELLDADSRPVSTQEFVDRWRKAGKKVGLLRLRLIRPWPAAEISSALAGLRGVAVIDQNIAPGHGGVLFYEVSASLRSTTTRPVLRSFIGGLGGKDISAAEFDHVLDVLEADGGTDTLSSPELLMTKAEWADVQQRLAVAGKPLQEAGE